MPDTVSQQTTPKKVFKPSTKTKTPIRSKAAAQSASQTDSAKKAANDTPRFAVSQPARSITPPASKAAAASKNLPENKVSRDQGPTGEPEGVLSHNTANESLESSRENPTNSFKSPTGKAGSFKKQGHPDMNNSVTSSAGYSSSGFSGDVSDASKSPGAGDKFVVASDGESESVVDEDSGGSPIKNGNLEKTSKTTNSKPQNIDSARNPTGSERESRIGATPNLPEPGDVSKVADGTFRDTGNGTSTTAPTNKMGEPDVSNISRTAQPAVSRESPEFNDQIDDAHVVDNMGRPTHVEGRFDIPLPRGPPPIEKSRSESFSQDLGDFEELPSTKSLPNLGDLPEIPDSNAQDPPEEILDPSAHAPSSPGVKPIPKIPKIPHIGSTPPADLRRLAQGLAGHVVDDVGNIVDESGKVLGHATGDLPAMVGKNVSEDGEIYGSDGGIIGYVSENFVDQKPPTEIPSHVLNGLKVDQDGNILGSDGNVIGKFHEKPDRDGSLPSFARSSSSNEEKAGEGPKKVNAHTGGSPSDIFLDVKSTTEGIQLTIRIPTTFTRPPPES
ncbi:hypothetical protein F4861DRAFT_544411 [Xylaria intraflava]|nr:hypothetical protein F4861DRAFT_544411 [Xylaria intraflava]